MAQSRTKERVITRNVIKALGFAGAISVALVAPNSTVLIETYMKHMDKKNAKKTLRYLKYRKLIEVREKNGTYYYKLTSKGHDKFEKVVIEDLKIPVPKRWDKKWRLVMFDIPAAHHKKRQFLLQKLRGMDFYKLQQSAWIHPFNCEKQIGTILQYLKLEQHVSLLVVEKGNFIDHATDRFKKAGLLM